MTLTVTFRNVGRAKATFTKQIDRLDHAALLVCVRSHLMSRDIDFGIAEDLQSGTVFSGMQVVGEFTVSQPDGVA